MHYRLEDFVEEIEHNIARGILDVALTKVQSFVEDVIQDPLSVAQVFASRDLDNLCQRIGAKAEAQVSGSGHVVSNGGRTRVAYIATQLYKDGGHTRVIEDFIKFQRDREHVILMTNLFGKGSCKYAQERFECQGIPVEIAPEGSRLSKLIWMQEQLRQLYDAQVYLFNHHQDAIAVAAVQPGLNKEVLYYHHCDHHLALGVTLDFTRHIDPHQLIFNQCRNNLGLSHNEYFPLAVEDLGRREEDDFLESNTLRTASSGGGHKFSATYIHNYFDVVGEIIAATGGTHLHIGHLSDDMLRRIFAGLEAHAIPRERFEHISWVSSLWRVLIEQKVDLYLSSFPMGGGRASVEVMGSGTPIVFHKHARTNLLGGADLGYPEAFVWSTPRQLYDFLRTVDKDYLVSHSRLARQYFDEHYHAKHLKKLLYGEWSEAALPSIRDPELDKLISYLSQRQLVDQRLTSIGAQNASVNQAMAEREAQVATLNQALVERDGQIASLHQALAEQRATIEAMRSSMLWRLTVPLRSLRTWIALK